MENTDNKPKIKAETKDQSFVETMAKNLFENYIVPKSRDIMHDTFSGFINMLGDTAQAGIDAGFKKIGWNGTTKINSSNTGTNYNKMYSVGSSNKVTVNSTASALSASATDMKLIFLNNEGDAKALLEAIKAHHSKYGKVSIGDVYNLLDPPITNTNFQTFKWGWKDIGQIGFIHVFTNEYGEEHRGQFMMSFPKPVNIETI